MPIKIPNGLPAIHTLQEENIFVINETRALTQDIRPLRILLLNLMPQKIITETQIARLIANTPLQVELQLLQTASHRPKHVAPEHMIAFYQTFDQIQTERFDGFIITGAPVEQMPFEQVGYWDELCKIMEWSKTHVTSTLHICWGAQAGLYYHFGIPKCPLKKKLSGIYAHHLDQRYSPLFRGFDDLFMIPHSRYTTCRREDIAATDALQIMASSEEAGVAVCMSENGKQIFLMGHPEYDVCTLAEEYQRDLRAGLDPAIPENYFPKDDPSLFPRMTWRSSAALFYSNWLNYFVYQQTPYNLNEMA